MSTESQPAGTQPRRRYTRRQLLVRLLGGGLVTGCTGAGMAAYARHVEPFWPAVTHVPMDFPNLGESLHGLRVLQLSDLHLSSTVPEDYLRREIAHAAASRPDLILLTGDYITAGRRRWIDRLGHVLDGMQARLGIFAVLGNHDFGVYQPHRVQRGTVIADIVEEALAAIGIVVLRNRSHVIRTTEHPLQLVGVDDLWSGFCDPDAAFAQVNPDLPTIALAHNPDTVPQLRSRPCHWILCGHTHGGQVRIPLLGAPVLPIENREYDAGLFELGAQRLYVNRGLGCLHQVRFDCRPEITVFTMVPRV